MAKKNTRKHYFETIDTIEINKQLDPSFLDLDEGQWEPKQVEHQLDERRLVADLICQPANTITKKDALSHRISTVDALNALCRKREPPRPRKRQPQHLFEMKAEAPELSTPGKCGK